MLATPCSSIQNRIVALFLLSFWRAKRILCVLLFTALKTDFSWKCDWCAVIGCPLCDPLVWVEWVVRSLYSTKLAHLQKEWKTCHCIQSDGKHTVELYRLPSHKRLDPLLLCIVTYLSHSISGYRWSQFTSFFSLA